jgi:peptidoglycan/LPS O-acetylase OafA/YrhL
MILALLGFSSKHLNFKNKFSEYMTENSFNYYILHYPLLVCISHYFITYIRLPFVAYYPILAALLALLLPLLIAIVKRLPVLRTLALGISVKRESGF